MYPYALPRIHQCMVQHALIIVHWEESPSKQHAFQVLSSLKQCTRGEFPNICHHKHQHVHGTVGRSATSLARNPWSLIIAPKVARKCKQPCSQLHHTASSLSQPKHTVCLLWHSPMHCKYSASLPHTASTHFPRQQIGKYPPRASIYTLHHPIHVIGAPL